MVIVDAAINVLLKLIHFVFFAPVTQHGVIFFPSSGATLSDIFDIYFDLVVVSQLFFDQKDCSKHSQVM